MAATYTAASCNYSDVNAVINGPTHTAVSGDTIIIPSGSCTWTSTLTISAGIDLTGSGTPNSGTSTFGAGTPSTTILDNAGSSNPMIKVVSGVSYGQTLKIELMNIYPYTPTTQLWSPISLLGSCTSSGCPQVRIDNINFGPNWLGTSAGTANPTSWLVRVDNFFGVMDHNTISSTPTGTAGLSILANVSHSSYLGVGQYGDNSWTQPDSFGTANAMYFENNALSQEAEDCDTAPAGDSSGPGGCRVVVRYNHITEGPAAYTHGTDSDERPRGGRQFEVYGNTIGCPNTSIGCQSADAVMRSGVLLAFSNTITSSNGAWYDSLAELDVYRNYIGVPPWNWCDGQGPWDTNDGITYASGTISAVSSTSGLTVTVNGSPGWSANQWVSSGSPYSIVDTSVTGYWCPGGGCGPGDTSVGAPGYEITGSTSNTLSASSYGGSDYYNGPPKISVGDSFQIVRAPVCIDQPSRSGGTLLSGSTPSPTGAVNQALDPAYQWNDITIGATFYGQGKVVFGNTSKLQNNRDFYYDQGSKFNGTVGTGEGLYSAIPSTCTPNVAYWATDKNTLYRCSATNTWTAYYTPYTFPHPLATGSCTIVPTSIGPYTEGESVSQQFGESNCTAGQTFTVSAGSLPSGLSLSSSGLLSGNLNSAGSFEFTISYNNGQAADPISLTINSTPTITTSSLPSGTVGSAYSQTLVTTGGTLPVSCAVTGSLPPSLSLTGCTISGTPTAAGTFSFSVTPTDATGVSGTSAALSTLVNLSTGNPPSTCPQNLGIGTFTLCGEAYNNVSSGSSVTVNYSPAAGNGIIAWATWCFSSSCNSSSNGITATIGDNVNGMESCFAVSPHSPFITDGNGGAQGSGDFQQFYVWYCPNIPSGVTSFTVTPSSSSLAYLQIHVSEWKAGGLSASCSPISACFENVDNDAQAGNTTGGTTATLSTNGATLNASDLIFAITQVPCCNYTGSTGTGYTGITVASASNPGMVVEAKSVSSTGVQTATTSWTGGNAAWFGVIVPFLSAGSGGTAPVVPTSLSAIAH